MGLRTSTRLAVGRTYSREQLRDQFGIVDATINTGIFRPSGHDSVWIFITEQKTSDRTQYIDRMEGDNLYFEGQTKGRTDALIREHRRFGVELLVFHRVRKDQRPDYSFEYMGEFEYVSDSAGPPTKFHLRRVAQALRAAATSEELSENIRRFQRDLPRWVDLAGKITRATTYWVFDAGRCEFAPSKFVGIAGMTFERYEAAGQADPPAPMFDGFRTRQAIQKIRGEFVQSDELEAALSEWIEDAFGAEALNGIDASKWRFATLEESTPRNGSASEASPSAGTRSGGQGFGLSPPQRRAVERHAQSMAEAHFRGLGYAVTDVSKSRPYDLHCVMPGCEIHVEVKGTTGSGDAVFLTRNEVLHGQKQQGRVALAIVTNIEVDRDGETPEARAGELHVFNPWTPRPEDLTPITYECRTPRKT